LEAVPEVFQFISYFDVVVDFTVEGDSEIAILGINRLVAGIQIDDFQACRACRKQAGLKYALLVRPPVGQGCGRLANSVRRRRPVFMCESRNSAQFLLPRVAPFEMLRRSYVITRSPGKMA